MEIVVEEVNIENSNVKDNLDHSEENNLLKDILQADTENKIILLEKLFTSILNKEINTGKIINDDDFCTICRKFDNDNEIKLILCKIIIECGNSDSIYLYK